MYIYINYFISKDKTISDLNSRKLRFLLNEIVNLLFVKGRLFSYTAVSRKKGSKFLWCCVSGEYYKIIWFYHLGDAENLTTKNASKPVARRFNLPNHSKQHMAVCGLSLHQGSTESRKTLEQKFVLQIGHS